MSKIATRLSRAGFDNARLTFGLRTAVASVIAMLAAWVIGLEHPQWSAMTVWAASQPVRGMLIEKSAFRALGTLVGTLFGVLLVMIAGDNLWVLVLGLSLWVGLCAGAGNVLSGMVAYGTLLSGYSASMVVLLNTNQVNGTIVSLGIDRLLTVLMGVLVALIIGLALTPRRAEGELTGKVRRTTASTLRLLAGKVSGTALEASQGVDALLNEIAGLEETFEPNSAGSLRSHQTVRALRDVVIALVAGALWTRRSTVTTSTELLSSALNNVAAALERAASPNEILALIYRAEQLSRDLPRLQELLGKLASALTGLYGTAGDGAQRIPLKRQVVLHRDWISARHALLRATGLLLIIGSAWIITGWSAGAFVMLGTSVMITLFSTFENPAVIMSRIFFWQCIGALGFLACRWLVWPWAGSELELVLMLVPFILLGILPFAHRRTLVGAMDYIMILLLLSQPALPLTGNLAGSVFTALAVVAGPLLAYLTFRAVFPTDAHRRRLRLSGMMVRELQTMAMAPDMAGRRHRWEARLYHRLLKLVSWVSKTGESVTLAINGSVAVIAVGEAIIDLHRLRQDAALTLGESRRIDAVLQRLSQLTRKPQLAERALGQTGVVLHRHGRREAEVMLRAAHAIDNNLDYFRSGTLERADR